MKVKTIKEATQSRFMIWLNNKRYLRVQKKAYKNTIRKFNKRLKKAIKNQDTIIYFSYVKSRKYALATGWKYKASERGIELALWEIGKYYKKEYTVIDNVFRIKRAGE